jgi:hypothetical protein
MMGDVPLSLQDCNRCGECCKRGGACIFRRWDHGSRPLEFAGRCDLLEDVPGGGTRCQILAQVRPEILKQWAPGTCEFPDWRREVELIQVGLKAANE